MRRAHLRARAIIHFWKARLTRTVELIRAKGGEAKAVAANVSVEDDCIALVQSARDYGPVDILVNNAALTYYQPITEMQTNRWVRAFAVDVHGPFMLAKEVLKDMIPRRSGAIINISSGAAIGPGRGPYADKTVRGGTMYGAVKAALERFTQGLAQEVAQYDGITVAAVSPSRIVPTPGTVYHKLVSGMDDPSGEPPIMMARAALLLASEPAEKVNGRVTYSQQILKEFGWIERGGRSRRGQPGFGVFADLTVGGVRSRRAAVPPTFARRRAAAA